MTHLAAGQRLSDRRALRPDQPAPDGAVAGRRPRGAMGPAGTVQRRGNVWVVQNPLPCLPCEKLGCVGHLDSHSRASTSSPSARYCSRSIRRSVRLGPQRQSGPIREA